MAISLTLIGTACAEESTTGARLTVDTLTTGVEVVRNLGAGIWSEDSRWSFGDEVVIGTQDGGGPAAFGWVVDFDLDPAGRVYVLDLMAQEVRVFDDTGTFIRVIGGLGGGPGELRGANGMGFDPSGRLWVVNPLNLRYSVFDTSGVLVKEFRRNAAPNTAEWLGAFSNAGTLYDWVLTPGLASTFVRYDTTYGTFVDSISMPSVPPETPFGWGHRLRTGRGWWLGVASEYRLYRTTPDGDTTQIVERAIEAAPLTAAERAAAEVELAELVDGARVSGHLRAPVERRLFKRLLVDDQDYLWVMLAGSDSASTETTFDVFDPSGRYLGALSTPHRVDSLPRPVVRGNSMVFRQRNALDVPFVVRLSIEGRP